MMVMMMMVIMMMMTVTDVHSQRLEDFSEFIEAMINEIGLTDGVTGDIPKVDVAVIDALISEYVLSPLTLNTIYPC
jgi:hypothetical protein